ncbi:ankyrin repeat domain-containing protein [Aureibacter tunicatorum]|uniref:Ankyrin repeat protein n=1 Tax=Aureibacter tunicatorum TaxID=866807 RepID=A0AAE3XUG8_9BACT|nr:ankyrin repeat domain-containing protein [Aureibacter tunicatorum]MDR6241924.1 ankyrin repeat protein [Aureibacter tunicatorum]BDD07473.1 hypothetical protein AUTU_49560 [Aureibacter tunicatorum]
MSKGIDINNIIENLDIESFKLWLDYKYNVDLKLLNGNDNSPSLIQYVLYEIDDPKDDNIINEMILLLINKGANVNTVYEDEYPILYAVLEERPLIVKTLLEANADIDIKDEIGRTPLTSAVISENIEIVKLLVKYSNRISINREGSIWVKTPLGIAFSNLNLEIIELLLKNNANPYLLDFDNGNIPIIDNIPKHLKEQIMILIDKYYHSS